ncbi:hypothetical protein AB0I91_13880 [Actinosynnema sp. NPDC049800]
MGDEKAPRPVERLFRASLLALGSVIALHLAVVYLKPIVPWLVGGAVLAVFTWAVTAFIRWRRSRW